MVVGPSRRITIYPWVPHDFSRLGQITDS